MHTLSTAQLAAIVVICVLWGGGMALAGFYISRRKPKSHKRIRL